MSLERGFLHALKALAARDAKARVATIVNALDTLPERSVDLRDRREAPVPIAEAHVAHEDFDQPFDNGLISSQQLQLVRTMKQQRSRSRTPFIRSVGRVGS